LKEIIDKINEEAIKKYQQNHDPYEQLKEVVEKNGTKHVGGHAEEPMSTIEKELLETYEEIFGNQSHTLKSSMSPNVDEKSSTCECTDINNIKLGKTKGRDKYLKHLKHRCNRGICFCSAGSVFLTLIGLVAARVAAVGIIAKYGETIRNCVSSVAIFNLFDNSAMLSALKASGGMCASGAGDIAGSALLYL
ncbi:hypothetical protein PFFCH_05307, partial [Plasmodium falciparum FCH/4]